MQVLSNSKSEDSLLPKDRSPDPLAAHPALLFTSHV